MAYFPGRVWVWGQVMVLCFPAFAYSQISGSNRVWQDGPTGADRRFTTRCVYLARVFLICERHLAREGSSRTSELSQTLARWSVGSWRTLPGGGLPETPEIIRTWRCWGHVTRFGSVPNACPAEWRRRKTFERFCGLPCHTCNLKRVPMGCTLGHAI